MADQSDALRMSAEIVDRFTPALRDMQRSLRAISAQTKLTHKEGGDAAKRHEQSLSDLRKTFAESGRSIRELFTPALVSVGVAGLGAAEGIKAITDAITEFAGTSRSMTFLSKQTGLTIN